MSEDSEYLFAFKHRVNPTVVVVHFASEADADDFLAAYSLRPGNSSDNGGKSHMPTTEKHDNIKVEAEQVIRTFGMTDHADLDAARAIASAAIDTYGDFPNGEIWEQYRSQGIWNDHVAVQAALVAIKMSRAGSAS